MPSDRISRYAGAANPGRVPGATGPLAQGKLGWRGTAARCRLRPIRTEPGHIAARAPRTMPRKQPFSARAPIPQLPSNQQRGYSGRPPRAYRRSSASLLPRYGGGRSQFVKTQRCSYDKQADCGSDIPGVIIMNAGHRRKVPPISHSSVFQQMATSYPLLRALSPYSGGENPKRKSRSPIWRTTSSSPFRSTPDP